MRRFMIAGICAAAFAVSAFARPVVDGRLQVEPSGKDRYTVDNARMGKAELFGYVGDFVDRDKITGIVLRKGERATDEQKHVIAITAKAQHIEAFIDLDGDVKPLVDPVPSPAPATPPPVDKQAPATH